MSGVGRVLPVTPTSSRPLGDFYTELVLTPAPRGEGKDAGAGGSEWGGHPGLGGGLGTHQYSLECSTSV